MTAFQAIVLGAVQGLTELLPISSSAHLFLIPWLLNWSIPESFDVALHFGTLLAIGLFFFKDWIELIKGGYKSLVKKERSRNRYNILVHSNSNNTRRNNRIYLRSLFR